MLGVAGDEINMKITTRTDIVLADRMLQAAVLVPSPEPHPTASLAGSRILVVGGTTGIGRAIADQAGGQGAVAEVAGTSAGLDVRDYAAVEACVARGRRAARRARPRRRDRGRAADRPAGGHGPRGLRRGHRRQPDREPQRRPVRVPPPAGEPGVDHVLRVVLVHPRPPRLRPLLRVEGGGGQPDPGPRRGVGRRRDPGQRREPRADRHADAPARVPRRGGRRDARARTRSPRRRSACCAPTSRARSST